MNRVFSTLIISLLSISFFSPLSASARYSWAQDKGQKERETKAAPVKSGAPSDGQRDLVEHPTAQVTQQTGRYYALVIGINNYPNVRPLKTAVRDAEAVAEILRNIYDFKTTLLLDEKATREAIYKAIDYYKTLDEQASLLVYYAGHGSYDQALDRAYWIPVNATSDTRSNWISAQEIADQFKAIRAHHILVISDSCFSGRMDTRDPGDKVTSHSTKDPIERQRFIQKMEKGRSRWLLASGGTEPVLDKGEDNHSVFANALLNGLKNIEQDEFIARELFDPYIQQPVAGKNSQTPEYSFIRNSGHDTGEFVFSRKVKREPNAEEEWYKIMDSENPDLFKEYEARFPKSKYAEEAAWKAIQTSKKWEDFKSYVVKYPQSANASFARLKADELYWEEVDSRKGLADYESYRKEYPTGMHAAQATYQIEEIVWQQVQVSHDYQAYINLYPEGRYAKVANSLLHPVTTTVSTTRALSVFTNPPVPNATVLIIPKVAGAEPIKGQIDATGSFSTELPTGLYDVEVSAIRYKAEKKKSVKVDKSGAITIAMIPLTGSILIGPVEADANIFLDGKQQTELQRNSNDKLIVLSDVAVGHYRLRVEQKQGSQTPAKIEREIDVLGGKQTSVITEFKPTLPSVGKLTIVTAPESEIYLDGAFKGKTDSQGLLPIDSVLTGPHYVEVRNTRYKNFKLDSFNVVAGDNPRLSLPLKPKVVDPSPWYDRFTMTDNWDAAKTWQLGWNGKNNLWVAGTEVGLENRSNYEDFELEFNVNIIKGNSAAWVVRAQDANNYYLFVLERAKERVTLYRQTSKSGTLSGRRTVGDYIGALPEQIHVDIAATGKEIKTYIYRLNGDKQLLGTIKDAEDFQIGKFGFRAVDNNNEFAVIDLQCRPKE